MGKPKLKTYKILGLKLNVIHFLFFYFIFGVIFGVIFMFSFVVIMYFIYIVLMESGNQTFNLFEELVKMFR